MKSFVSHTFKTKGLTGGCARLKTVFKKEILRLFIWSRRFFSANIWMPHNRKHLLELIQCTPVLIYFPGFYAGLSPALVGITPYMGLNFAIYESTKTFSESQFFQMNSKFGYKKGLENENTKTEGTLSGMLRKGLCGAIAGGTSKFIVYPLVSDC